MSYFYATRRDKQGRKLVTSYAKQEQAKKYGGADASISKDTFYLDATGNPTKDDTTGLILRSKIEGEAKEQAEGRFVVYMKDGDAFVPTKFRFPTYGAANTGMKSLVDLYGTLAVVEEPDAGEARTSVSEETYSDESPF